MPWLIGVDEAGYGPNLGPFVMTSVACRLPEEHAGADLWQLLAAAVRKEDGCNDQRVTIDDSKRVYSPARGLGPLERGVQSILGLGIGTLDDLLARLCPDCLEEVRREAWYRGALELPCENTADDLAIPAANFVRECRASGNLTWEVCSVVICPPRFNSLSQSAGSKGAVLADGLGRLLRWNLAQLAGDDALTGFIDKHGGRNAYAAQLQHALPGGAVIARKESLARSVYHFVGLGRDLTLTFQPRADAEHFCVALASMTSKYLREVLMREFNHFWAVQVPGLKATAGYPGDSARFLASIRPALVRLGVDEAAVWRKR